jgi:hypothetical protein
MTLVRIIDPSVQEAITECERDTGVGSKSPLILVCA